MDLNHVLTELYKLLAADKISPRRGAVMAYTCSLLRTLPAIDDDISPEPAMVNRCAERCARSATPVEADGYDGYTSNPDKGK